MSVKHSHQSATPNNPAHEISSTRWNDNHTVSIVNADVAAGAGIVESKLALNFPTRAAVTPGGSNANVQYNNSGTFAGARLDYSYAAGDVLLATELSGDDGDNLLLKGADALSDGYGGEFTLEGGEAPGAGNGGGVLVQAGQSVDGNGGAVRFYAGDSATAAGGNILFKPGQGIIPGKILFTDVVTAAVLELDLSLLASDRILTMPNANGTIALLNGSGDLEFPVNTDGVVLKDRTTGLFYRLYVNSGALLIEAA